MKKSSFVSDFKKFIMRGNVVDMAVGVVVGGAFSKIVGSLVADIVTPLISILTGKVDLTSLTLTLAAGESGAEPVLLRYGLFFQNIIDFLVIALCVFTAVRLMSKLHRKQEAPAPKPAAPAEPSREECLLAEIRDLLKDGKTL